MALDGHGWDLGTWRRGCQDEVGVWELEDREAVRQARKGGKQCIADMRDFSCSKGHQNKGYNYNNNAIVGT